MVPKIIEDFVKKFSKEIKNAPDGFYSTFQYTKTGKTWTHPLTLGYITKVLWNFENVANIYIDLRVNVKKNNKKVKFQPDIFVCGGNDEPLLVIDYESPNSSDSRIPSRNILHYLNWGRSTPYIIITTLPKRESPDWELRYASKGDTNGNHKGKLREIQKNPFSYWYKFYRDELRKNKDALNNVYFININGNEASLEDFINPVLSKTF